MDIEKIHDMMQKYTSDELDVLKMQIAQTPEGQALIQQAMQDAIDFENKYKDKINNDITHEQREQWYNDFIESRKKYEAEDYD